MVKVTLFANLLAPADFHTLLGYIFSAAGGYNESACATCPAGFSCPAGLALYPRSVHLCRAGFYCPNGTGPGEEVPCPAGTYSRDVGNRELAQCRPCPPSRYCLQVRVM